ncbi:MAG: hypothetical protein F6K11_00020 [Leptolyngbya sp. SIO3F4]|nr:hypothetical protein [Leptolyngbya sp. SIO3F4]
MQNEEKVEFVNTILRQPQTIYSFDRATIPSNCLDSTDYYPELTQIGIDLLHEGKIAVVMMAGGLSTRMNCEGLRGDLPIGPVTKRSIFQLQAEKIAAIKKRFSPQMPWIIITSSPVHDATISSFESRKFFGIPSNEILFLKLQKTLPIVNIDGEPIYLQDGSLMESPIGHGGLVNIISSTNLLQNLKQQGIEYLFYFQYPNVLEKICDFTMLGYHQKNGFEVTTKTISEYQPKEKVGRCIQIGERNYILEYHFLKNIESNSWLHNLPASTGTHIWSISFLERCLKQKIQLPYYLVRHHSTNSDVPLFKAECFIFDLIPYSIKSGIFQVDRNKEYAVVKRRHGDDSLKSAQNVLNKVYKSWLKEAGAIPKVQDNMDYRVEVSPLFALSSDDLNGKIRAGFRYEDNLVLR